MAELSDIPTLAELEARLNAVPGLDAQALEAESIAVLGRKSGALTAILRRIPTLPVEERRGFGAAVNDLKRRFEEAFAARRELLGDTAGASAPRLDLTMPARERWRGGMHPVTRVVRDVTEIFRRIGFAVATGPEVEDEWYNFLALNFPADHPAMDMHDTLYLEPAGEPAGLEVQPGGRLLLRTHTSPVQIRVMQAGPPPYRVIIPGMCYRNDAFDPSHAPAFHQIEGLAVDEGIGFVDLKATLTYFARQLFGQETVVRFRPSFFPFTEPSAEMDVRCGVCGGGGCPACKGTGWMEILGCGMVHPRVLDNAGVDSERYTGWAFGMGPARMAMNRYGIPDIRLLYEGDMRVLGQFAGGDE
ncbi:MAG: phenylalanine--tRNA ligase subunit alpha [Gemmatimonadetes bacterium]|nr:phenylalanine--tRNA ligase subunit alpha [Gemmatimonadota bacterium]